MRDGAHASRFLSSDYCNTSKNVTLKLSAKLGFLGYGGATHLSPSLSATPSSAIALGSTLTVASEERSEGDGITRERFLVAERERERGVRFACRCHMAVEKER